MELKVFKNQFIRTLASNIAKNKEKYLSGDFLYSLEAENGENFFTLQVSWLDEKALQSLNAVAGGAKDEVNDARDANVLYSALKGMPPFLARDPRIWATLTHTYCIKYVRDRNWKFVSVADEEEFVKNIKSRFFIENSSRAFERTNAIARLWWFGYIAETTGLPFQDAVDVLLSYTDFRAATVERPDIFVHREIRAAVVDLAIAKTKAGDPFYTDRARYRHLFKEVTERAARVFFPTMDHAEVVTLISTALSAAATDAPVAPKN
jgi:hypothetical protein